MSVNNENSNSIITINPRDDNKYELIYVNLNGVINIVNKTVWQTQTKYDATGSNITDLKTLLKISKITQINTGDFIYLGDNCNVYRVPKDFKNNFKISEKKFSGITQLSNYKLLLTTKEGKMYTVDDVNNFDETLKPFFDDDTIYCSVKQTFDGYVVAIDGTQCGNAWRFDLVKNKLINKTKLNLDEGITNRVTVFFPSQTALINLNCDSRYKNRLLKYEFSDKTIKTKYDLRCDEDEVFESQDGGTCYKKCKSGYSDIKGDYTSCWENCRDDYKLSGGVCYLQESTTYDRGVGIIPDDCKIYDSARYCDEYYRVRETKTRKCNKSCPDGWNKTNIACGVDGSCERHVNGDCKTYRCKDGYDRVGSGAAVTCWGCKCKSNRVLEDGLCYIPCRDGYKGNATICSNTKSWSYVPKTDPRVKAGRSGYPTPITCDSDCCMFDLTFYNPSYSKPDNIPALPNLPVLEGLVGYYDATSFFNGVWYDLSPSNNNAVYIKGDFTNNGTFITGNNQSTILFPTQILPSEYTVFNLAKYNGLNKGKILSGYLNSWVSGFVRGLSGISIRDKPITQSALSAFDDNWVFSTDTLVNYKANGMNLTTQAPGTNVSTQLSINLNDNASDNSDFAIGYVIVFNRTLSNTEISSVESWLKSRYSDLWASTYTQTFAQLGYSCFNGSIGKVTNDYNNYTYASYKNGLLGCDWLNLPEKKNFNPLVCTSPSSEQYETFQSIENNNNVDNKKDNVQDIIFYLLIGILVFIFVRKANEKNK